MAWDLSGGAIEAIMTGGQLAVDKPILQVLGQKKIAASSGQGTDRYRILLSDGIHSHSSAMLATQLNEMITSGDLDTFSIIRLDKYLCNVIQPDRRVVILLGLTILAPGDTVGHRLGSPQQFKAGAGGAAAVQAESTPAAPVTQPQQQAKFGASGGAAAASSNSPPAGSAYSNGPSGGGKFYNNNNTPQQKRSLGAQNLPKTPGGTPARVHPINTLTPYQNRWTIRARVTNKSNIRTWSNSRGEGKLFNINLLDESGEIRATLFKEQVDKYYEMIELNQVYYISKAQLKTADKRYSSLPNDYEMTFNSETTLIPCEEDVDLPSITFNFVAINQLGSHEPNSTVDVIGVTKSAADLSTVMGRQSNKEIQKRDVTLVDENQVQVRVTLWGTDAQNFDGAGNPILAVKGCRLSDWGGRSLSVLSSSQVIINPDIPEAHHLRGWYDNVGHSLDYNEYANDGGSGGGGGYATNWKTFSQVKNEGLGQDKPEYFTTKATIVFLKKDNCMYMACANDGCNKKVIDQGNGMFRCEKCQKEFPNHKWRMILSTNLADFTDNQWATCFQDTAEIVLGRKSEEIGQLKEQDESGFDQMFQEANFKSFIFKMRAKMETYNDEARLKTVCVQATPIDFKEHNKRLIEDIDKMLSQ